MQLLNKTLEARFKQMNKKNSNSKDPIVIAKFFNPTGIGRWFATEYDPVEKIFFGYVSLFGDHCDEFGSFSLSELQSVKCSFGLGIERDLYFTEKPVSEIIKQYTKN